MDTTRSPRSLARQADRRRRYGRILLAVAGLVCSLVGLAGCVAWLMLVGAIASSAAAGAAD